jgi:DNA-binding CsgD family transcriptional regulator
VPYPPALSERQLEVLRLLAQGLSHRQIGRRLDRSFETIRSHTLIIRHYFGVHSNVDAVAKAREWDLLGATS